MHPSLDESPVPTAPVPGAPLIGPVSRPTLDSTTATTFPYHRAAHVDLRPARWWTPLTTFGATALLYLGFLAPVAVVAVAYAVLVPYRPGLPTPSDDFSDPLNPLDWAIGLGLIALLLPAVVLGVRWGGRRRGTIHSVTGRFRWGLVGSAVPLVVPLYGVVTVGGFLLRPPSDLAAPAVTPALLLSLGCVLILGPLQCAAEEYAFRGLPQQMLGTWLRSPVWGIVLPVPFFVVGHGYDGVGQIGIAAFALCTGFLVWKTGGLELAVLVHVANNIFLFLLAPFSASSMEQGAIEPLVLLVDLALLGSATVVLTVWFSRREGLRLREPYCGRAPAAGAGS